MKALNPIHKIVARELALGFLLEAICSARNLDIAGWRRITASTLFQQEVKRIQDRLEEQEVEAYHENPAMQRLKTAQIKAVDMLVDEIDNCDPEMGASSTTRIKACNSVIEKSGLVQKEEAATVTIIQISPNKQELLSTPATQTEMPDRITGVPAHGI